MLFRPLSAALAPLALLLSFSLPAATLKDIDTIVVIYAENHSFDNIYGLFPGANGITNATEAQKTQLDHDGTPLKELIVFNKEGQPDAHYPRLPNRPFRIDQPPISRGLTQLGPGPIHAFYHNQEQINHGQNNMFVAMSSVGGWVMGYYDTSSLKMWQWAKEYTLADNFFMSAFGGSYLNHQWLICACTPTHPNAPAEMHVVLDSNGKLLKKESSPSANIGAVQVYSFEGGQVTPDGFSVNTTQPAYQPSGIPPEEHGDYRLASPKGNKVHGAPLPPQHATTIGDTLSEKDISWAWYGEGFALALADGMQPPEEKRKIIYEKEGDSPHFQAHHQPFNYFENFAPGTKARELHLKDGQDFIAAIEAGTLPQVSFYKPAGKNSQHPSQGDIAAGDAHMHNLLERLSNSPQWPHMLIIVTYDENGGYWDHVAPPTGEGWGDRFGPGTRIPAILIGPYVKKGHIDSTPYDTTSILKLITKRFDLRPLPGVREKMGDFEAALIGT